MVLGNEQHKCVKAYLLVDNDLLALCAIPVETSNLSIGISNKVSLHKSVKKVVLNLVSVITTVKRYLVIQARLRRGSMGAVLE